MIKFELSGNTTIVTELSGDDGSNVINIFAFNSPQNYHLEGVHQALIFDTNSRLTKLGIRFDNLTTATGVLLGGAPISQVDLLQKIGAANLFRGY